MDQNICLSEDDINFENSNKIGFGAFGEVFQGTIKRTGEIVAIKKVFQDKRYKNRELDIMRELNHPNIVTLISYYYTNSKSDDVYLNCVMNYVPLTLSDLIAINKKENKQFPLILLKVYAYQMLKSIGYLHSIGICHRDIKPQNILINPSDMTLKLCDFGCAKRLIKNEPNIAYICSRYYRPPELVIGATDYTTQIDVWSMGCVIAELVLCKPLFPGSSATDQLNEIISILGSPTQAQIKEMNPKCKNLKIHSILQKEWSDVFKDKNPDYLFVDLISKLLVYEPNLRLTPYKALCHPFFDELKDIHTLLPNGKELPSHLFKFQQCEILHCPESVKYIISSTQLQYQQQQQQHKLK